MPPGLIMERICTSEKARTQFGAGDVHTTQPISRHLKKLLTIVICFGAIAFLGMALHRSWNDFTHLALNAAALAAVGLLSFGHAASFTLLFASWTYTLRRSMPDRVQMRQASYVYFIANIAKYLPGNVFHFAGRQILGKRAGWRHIPIARATLLEISAIAATGSILLLLFVAIDPGHVEYGFGLDRSAVAPHTIRTTAIILLAAAVLVFTTCSYFGVFRRLFGAATPTVVIAVLLCGLFFLGNAAMAVVLGHSLGMVSPDHPALSIGASYVAAWVAGFVVPGAPGGLGVRESVLVLFAGSANGDMAAPALGLAVGMRLASTLGDLICAAGAVTLWRHSVQGTNRRTNEASDG